MKAIILLFVTYIFGAAEEEIELTNFADLVITIEQEEQDETEPQEIPQYSALEEMVGDVEFDLPRIMPSFNPIRILTTWMLAYVPEDSIMRQTAVKNGVPITLNCVSRLLPGGRLAFQVVQFYAPTEADLALGQGTWSRKMGEKFHRYVETLPNGEKLVTYIQTEWKPDGATTFTEAFINAVVGEVAKTRIDQGKKEFAKSLSQNIIKQFMPLGSGYGIIASYQYVKRKFSERREKQRLNTPPFITGPL